jgi:hypothetical protein
VASLKKEDSGDGVTESNDTAVALKGKLMKTLFYKCIGAMLWVGGWLLVNSMLLLDEISEAAGDLFRRRP